MTQKKSTPKKKKPSKYDGKFSIGGCEEDFFKALRDWYLLVKKEIPE